MELAIMSRQMRRIAGKMESTGDLALKIHSRELKGAACMAETWVEGISNGLHRNT